jgi:uncharacterized membrane protein
MRLKVWILIWAIIGGGLLFLANFVAIILYIALYVWK